MLSLEAAALDRLSPIPTEQLQGTKRMGVVVTSYMQRRGQRGHEKSKLYPPFSDALAVIEHCHQAFNAGGVQIGIGPWNSNE
ncbi:MAG: hypothetical protein ACI9DF_005529, partial [Verrucomicrobiales bacterium]